MHKLSKKKEKKKKKKNQIDLVSLFILNKYWSHYIKFALKIAKKGQNLEKIVKKFLSTLQYVLTFNM